MVDLESLREVAHKEEVTEGGQDEHRHDGDGKYCADTSHEGLMGRIFVQIELYWHSEVVPAFNFVSKALPSCLFLLHLFGWCYCL